MDFFMVLISAEVLVSWVIRFVGANLLDRPQHEKPLMQISNITFDDAEEQRV
jgi:hypothetical protein